MGDRANVCMIQKITESNEVKGVCFYTHNGGSGLAKTVQAALNKKERWSDYSYLARIIFCQMVNKYVNDTLSFGISFCMQDNSYNILCVDVVNERVLFVPEEIFIGDTYEEINTYDNLVKGARCSWSFKEYCNLTIAELNKEWVQW